MADPNDVRATKTLRREFNRRMIDVTHADLRVTHGIAYVRGVIIPVKGGPTDLRAEIELIGRILHQRVGIKDVIIDCVMREG